MSPGAAAAVDDETITNASTLEWVLFNVCAVVVMMIDLLRSDGSGERGSKLAAVWTVVWVVVSLLFCLQLYFVYNSAVALNFLTGYVIEESLSLDNLFVILLTFESFGIEKADQHKVLFWGILSAIFLRGAAIFAGIALIERFEWCAQPPPPPAALGAPADRPLFFRRMLQAFGVLLLIAVFRILTEEEEEDDDDIGDPGSPLGGEGGMGAVDEEGGSPRKSGGSKGMSQNGLLLRFIKLFFRVSEDSPRGCFFTRDASARLCATPLFVALLVVEGSDIIFAADSIPAIFGVTVDPYVVYTSNICAILGLRSLYFILAEVLENFSHIKYGLAAVLGFVAIKILIAPWLEVHAGLSLLIIVGILGLTAALGGVNDKAASGPGMPGSPKTARVSARAKAQYGNVMQMVNVGAKSR